MRTKRSFKRRSRKEMKKQAKKLLLKLIKAEARFGVTLGRGAAKYDGGKRKALKYTTVR